MQVYWGRGKDVASSGSGSGKGKPRKLKMGVETMSVAD